MSNLVVWSVIQAMISGPMFQDLPLGHVRRLKATGHGALFGKELPFGFNSIHFLQSGNPDFLNLIATIETHRRVSNGRDMRLAI
jgi:hypothetical protein